MKFSGHETFAVREGWLRKGLQLVEEEPECWLHDRVEDALGVGRNMGKSIRHWLDSTGLVEFPRGKEPKPTDLGTLVWEQDPYFAQIGTWWILHAELVNSPEKVTTWSWFFNSYVRTRFTKADCLVTLRRYLDTHALNRTPPSGRTLERDVACLLASYARPYPPEPSDPEDAQECPFRELGLLRHFLESGTYQSSSGQVKEIPPQIFAHVLANTARQDAPDDAEFLEVSLQTAAGAAGGPGRVFGLTAENLFGEAMQVETPLGRDFEIAGLAGERTLRVRNLPPLEWLARYYKPAEARDAA